MKEKIYKYTLPVVMFIIFETVAITLWLSKNNIFYLFNFSYIGMSIALGLGLMIAKNKYVQWMLMLPIIQESVKMEQNVFYALNVRKIVRRVRYKNNV